MLYVCYIIGVFSPYRVFVPTPSPNSSFLVAFADQIVEIALRYFRGDMSKAPGLLKTATNSTVSHYILVWPRVIGRSCAVSQPRPLLPYDLSHSRRRFVALYVESGGRGGGGVRLKWILILPK